MSNPNPESSGPPLRALAMVLISLAVVFAGVGFLSLGGSDDTETATPAATSSAAPAPSSQAPVVPETEDPETEDPAVGEPQTQASPTTTSAEAAPGPVSVRVLNNSNVSGLAADVASTLQSEGFTVSETGNYPSGTIPTSTVFYDDSVPGERAEAERIASTLGIGAEPRFEGIASSPPGIIVIVTQ